MRRVLIGTPAHDGRVDVHFTKSLVQTSRLCMEQGIYQREVFLSYDSIIHNARNDILRLAVENDFDDLIFIDGDQDWQPEWIPKLLSYPVDVVGGAVRKKTDETELYNVKHPSFDIPVDPKTGLLMPESLGTGFLRLSRKAMKALWDSSEEYRIVGAEPSRWVFDIRPINGFLVGEDTMLGMKLKALGFATHLDPAMTCGHIGAKRFVGDFAAWLARAKAQHPKEEADGLWVVASRQRVGMLDRMFKAMLATGTSTPGVVLVQKDELKANLAEYSKLVAPKGWMIQPTEADGMVDKWHQSEPLYMGKRWVGALNDDHVPETQGWDRLLVDEALKTGRMICSEDGSPQGQGRISGALAMPIALVRAMGGHVVPIGFNHLYVDDAHEALNAQTGCARRLSSVMVRHLHPWVTGLEDDTHRKSYSIENQLHDKAALEAWKADTMPGIVAEIRKYLASENVPAAERVPPVKLVAA